MNVIKTVCAALVVSAGFVGAAQAQSLRSAETPAEYPPSTYKGNQYVDSRGCVYIRAGIDGNTTWVPRVSRQRKPVCGMEPTKIANAGEAPLATRPRGVEQITLEPEVETAAVAPAPAPVAAPTRVVRQTAAPAPKPRPSLIRRAAPQTVAAAPAPTLTPTPAPTLAPSPKPVVKAPAPVVAAPAAAPARTVASAPGCKGASPVSQRYINSGSGLAVRCGPQAVSPSGRAVPVAGTSLGGGVVVAGRDTTVQPETRIVPKHVAQTRAGTPDFKVPKGYRAAWEDDRLNPRRAEGNLRGWANMKLVWTDTTPRRLIDQTSGRDLTGEVALVYPFTDFATQQRDLGKVSFATRNGQKVKRILRNPGATSAADLAKRPVKPVVATRSEAPKVATRAPVRAKPVSKPVSKQVAKSTPKGETLTGKRYVQVATFGVPQNAQATAAKLKRLGLPVRIGKLTRGGKTLRLVLAGPFADNASAQRALRAARGAGFSDAYVRK